MLSKSSSKKEVLENYITTLIREREKLEHNEKKRKNASNQDDSSESEGTYDYVRMVAPSQMAGTIRLKRLHAYATHTSQANPGV